MFHDDFILIVESAIIIVETIVLLFLIYHIRELRRSTVFAHEQIQAMRKAIDEMHTYVKELHKETNITHKHIGVMKEALAEMHEFVKELRLKERAKR